MRHQILINQNDQVHNSPTARLVAPWAVGWVGVEWVPAAALCFAALLGGARVAAVLLFFVRHCAAVRLWCRRALFGVHGDYRLLLNWIFYFKLTVQLCRSTCKSITNRIKAFMSHFELLG